MIVLNQIQATERLFHNRYTKGIGTWISNSFSNSFQSFHFLPRFHWIKYWKNRRYYLWLTLKAPMVHRFEINNRCFLNSGGQRCTNVTIDYLWSSGNFAGWNIRRLDSRFNAVTIFQLQTNRWTNLNFKFLINSLSKIEICTFKERITRFSSMINKFINLILSVIDARWCFVGRCCHIIDSWKRVYVQLNYFTKKLTWKMKIPFQSNVLLWKLDKNKN